MKAFSTAFLLCTAMAGQSQSVSFAPTFGNNGVLTITLPLGGEAYSHAWRSGGKLLLAGDIYDGNTNSYRVSLAVIDTVCGALDMSFGSGGVADAMHEGRTLCHNIAIQPDGKIVGVGMIAPGNAGSQQWPGVYRFNADGSVDSTFNTTGYNRFPFDGVGGFDFSAGNLTSVFVNADSTILCAGTAFDGLIGAFRFNYDGTPDTTYGIGGAVRMQTPSFTGGSRGAGYLQEDSTLLVVTSVYNGSTTALAIAKFDAFGAPDSSFGINGLAVSSVPAVSPVLGMAMQPDGRFLVSTSSGSTDTGFTMARFMPDGALDVSYGMNGVSAVDGDFPGWDERGRKMQLLADGSTLQFGRVVGQYPVILQRDADGNVVTTFGTNGFAIANSNDGNAQFYNGLVLTGGDVIGYGGTYPFLFLADRLTTDPVMSALPVISISGSDLTCTGAGELQWYLDGVLISGATASTFTPAQNGTYTVTMTVSADCEFTSAPFNMLSVGVADLNAAAITVVNNPVTDMLVVLNNSGVVRYELLSIEGQRIVNGLLHGGRNAIDMNGMASGIYLLRTWSNGEIATQRIIKN